MELQLKKKKLFHFILVVNIKQMESNYEVIIALRLLWQSGGYESELPKQGARVQPPVWKIRSHVLHGSVEKKKKKKRIIAFIKVCCSPEHNFLSLHNNSAI